MSVNVDPTLRNGAPDSLTFGAIVKVNLTGVQWRGLALREFRVNFSKYKFLFWVLINRKDSNTASIS